jgi:hypothetical protein
LFYQLNPRLSRSILIPLRSAPVAASVEFDGHTFD